MLSLLLSGRGIYSYKLCFLGHSARQGFQNSWCSSSGYYWRWEWQLSSTVTSKLQCLASRKFPKWDGSSSNNSYWPRWGKKTVFLWLLKPLKYNIKCVCVIQLLWIELFFFSDYPNMQSKLNFTSLRGRVLQTKKKFWLSLELFCFAKSPKSGSADVQNEHKAARNSQPACYFFHVVCFSLLF